MGFGFIHFSLPVISPAQYNVGLYEQIKPGVTIAQTFVMDT